MMLIKIAWRNIWRSKGRSMVVLGSIVVGIWALISAVGFMNGFMVGYIAGLINHEVSNVQIHNPEFKKDREVQFVISDVENKTEEIRSWESVQAVTTRMLISGMIASPKKASAVQIKGIDVANEASVTRLDSLIGEGTYFDGIKKNPILIGRKLADNLGVEVKSKVVLTFSDVHQNLTSAAFRVVGILETSSVNLSEMTAFVRQDDLAVLLGSSGVHEIAILTQTDADEQAIVDLYQSKHPEDLAETWKEVAPEMSFMQEMYGRMLYVLVIIVMVALVFGIVNTMLMAVLERIRELGMLMAVGMTRIRVFLMVMLETIFLGLLGMPFGLGFGWAMISYFTQHGVDLSAYSEGLEAYGYDTLLIPYVSNETYFLVAVAVFVTAFIGALYPAWKAVRLKPIEALHTI